jgi:Ni/Fe-hydrogenase subunit HybB-like protein
MAILIIPLAISVHTVVSWIFGMTLQPMWHSTIFGPYFVIGAIYSGIATILIAMAILRKVFNLEKYLKPLHFRYLGLLLITFNALWFYFTFTEYLTTGYGNLPHEMAVFNTKVSGEYGTVFWVMVAMMVVAFVVLLLPNLPKLRRLRLPAFRPRYAAASGAIAIIGLAIIFVQTTPIASVGLSISPTISGWLPWLIAILLLNFFIALLPVFRGNIIAGTVIASLLVDVGMWLERFTIVIPTETRPIMLYSVGVYRPTWVEWSITAAAVAGFALMYALFVKIFPIISIWEVQEAKEAIPTIVEKLESFLPGAPEAVGSARRSKGGS